MNLLYPNVKRNLKTINTKTFIHADNIDNELKAELVLSCDVIYRLIEDDTYIKNIWKIFFSMSKKYVIIYGNNKDENPCVHVKFRIFTNYIETNFPGVVIKKHIANKINPQSSSFYIYKKVDNAIITMNLGSRDYINYTKPFMVKYSKQTNSKLIIDEHNIENIIKSFPKLNKIIIGRNNNKSYLYKVLVILYYSRIFNKILWVDDTCFIKETCINLYDLIEDNYILSYNEGENKELNSWKMMKNI